MKRSTPPDPKKTPTGIRGLDEVTGGGLPTGRSTLVLGGPGSGKTVLALETLVHGAQQLGEPGIFVAFEESAERIVANAAGFGWSLPDLQHRDLFFLDAQPPGDLLQAGKFDLLGLLAVVEAKARSMNARRIVFDSVDMVLALLGEPLAERRELLRLHDWLLRTGLTSIITAKAYGSEIGSVSARMQDALQFLVDCVVGLDHWVEGGVSYRSLRVHKYRGSAFFENSLPLVIGARGLEVSTPQKETGGGEAATTERVSTGVERLDTMLGGGYFRNSSVLITGSPGTAKSTFCGAFAEAASQRGERTLFLSFDSEPGEVVRNLASVGIRLGRFQRKGILKLIAPLASGGSTALQLQHIRTQAAEHRARCLVVDPISALGKQQTEAIGPGAAEWLTRWSKAEGITLVCSSLLDSANPLSESTPVDISTLADTWIHLSYHAQGGERNRALTIVKSRGMAHSNQVRELVLSDSGITLADVYAAGGEVLMGTMRWEREEAVREEARRRGSEIRGRMLELSKVDLDLAARAQELERLRSANQAEREALRQEEKERASGRQAVESSIRSRRHADSARRPRTKKR